MSIRDLAQGMSELVDKWEALRVDRALQMALDVNALRKSRIINDRVDHLGNSFGLYALSTQAKKEKSGNTRDNNPLLFDSGFSSLDYPNINFTDTGEMWRQNQPKIVEQSDQIVRIRVEPVGDRREVMEILDGKFGPINRLSENEENFIVEYYNSLIEQDFNELNLN